MDDCMDKYKNEDKEPTITVAVVTFNHGRKIFSCLDSILNQKYHKIDLVVIDDNSCDFDQDEVRNYIQQRNSGNIQRLIVKGLERHCGAVGAYKCALQFAQGEYILYMSGDDYLADDEVLADASQKLLNENTDILQGCAKRIHLNEEVVIPDCECVMLASSHAMPELFKMTLCTESSAQLLCIQSAFFRTSKLRTCVSFSDEYQFAVDWLIYTALLFNGARFSATTRMFSTLRGGGAYRADNVGNVYIRRGYLNEAAIIIREFGIRNRASDITAEEIIMLDNLSTTYEYQAVRSYDWGYYSLADKCSWLWEQRKRIFEFRATNFGFSGSKYSLKQQFFVIIACLLLWLVNLELKPIDFKYLSLVFSGIFLLEMLFPVKDHEGYIPIDYNRILSLLSANFVCMLIGKIVLAETSIILWYLLVVSVTIWFFMLFTKITAKLISRSAKGRIVKRWQQL